MDVTGPVSCCVRTLQARPQAAVCTECERAIVRCTRCRQPTPGDGFCRRCLHVDTEAETGVEVPQGARGSFRLRLRNEGESAVWLVDLGWRATGEAEYYRQPLSMYLERQQVREFVLGNIDPRDNVVPSADVSLRLSRGKRDREVHELVAYAYPFGRLRMRDDRPGQAQSIHVSVAAGGQYVGGDYQRSGPPAPSRQEPSWVPLPLSAGPGVAAPATPLVDRRALVLWPDPKTGEEQVHHFAFQPTLLLGRQPGYQGVGVRWYPPPEAGEAGRQVFGEVSRCHARLEVAQGRLWFVDVSTNGSSVNGERVTPNEPCVLRHEDLLAPWCDLRDPRFASVGGWRVFFRSGSDGFAREVVFRYTRE